MASRSTTVPEQWPISRLEAALSDDPATNEHVELPKFQRSVVWSEKKQRALIQSLLEGYPVGSLLLYERPSAADRKTYLLVDGLQRTTAIQNYLKEPLGYMTIEALADARVGSVRKSLRSLAENTALGDDAIDATIEEWMQTTRTLEQAQGFSGYRLAQQLARRFAPDAQEADRDELMSAAEQLVDDLRELSDIRNVVLPAIVYRGPENVLPDIFERINALGTSLSKYEIFAAAWVNQETEVGTVEVRDAVARRYQDYIDKGFRVYGIGDDGSIPNYSLFDYLFGLGKVVAQRFPLLFGEPSDATSTESAAFTLATLAHGMRVADMKKLPGKMSRSATTQRVDPQPFEEALVDACDFVNSTLRPFIGLKLNKASGGTLIVHTEYQVSSMIARALAARYEPQTWEEREGWQAEREMLKLTLPQRYLYDVLQQNWRGAGDTRLYNWTWKQLEGDSDPTPSPMYLEQISPDEWAAALRSYFQEQMGRVQRMRSHVRAVDKLFLKFVYSGIVSYQEEMQKTFEIDHLFPVSRLVELIGDDEDGWPISAVANLAMFENDLNREKTKYTVSEYLERVPADSRAERRKSIERYLLCETEACEIGRDVDGSEVLTRVEYESFLHARFLTLSARVLDSLNVANASLVVAMLGKGD